MPEPVLDLRIAAQVGSLTLQAELRATAAWTVLFGPSGSGKSSLMRAVAGLLRSRSGRIVVCGVPVFDSERRLNLPAHRRPIRWAGQSTALFPRLTVRQNIEYGLGNLDRAARAEAVGRVLRHFGLVSVAERLPATLSGGQRQRVAVVRAAAGARGRLLLLDEPFNGLDHTVRGELIAALHTWLAGSPVLSITHDAGEAMLLGADVARVAEGAIVAHGPARSLLVEERNAALAALGHISASTGTPDKDDAQRRDHSST